MDEKQWENRFFQKIDVKSVSQLTNQMHCDFLEVY